MNNSRPRVDIVVCACGNKEITSRCLDSLMSLTYPNYGVILVDDGSNDGSAKYLRNKYPKVNIVENSRNLGAAKSRNRGINLSQAKYIVTMDNDAALTPNWLVQMVDLMESDKNIAQASGKILFFDNPKLLAEAGGSMQFRGKCYDIGLGQSADDKKYSQTRRVLIVSTASMIVRRDALKRLGGIADIYYYGYEDSDLSYRINSAGYKVIYYPEAVSYHALSTTVVKTIGKKRVYYWMRNRLLMMLRNYELKNLIKYLPSNIRFTLGDCYHHPERIIPTILAWLWIIFNLPRIFIQRAKINRLRTVKDAELHKLFNLE